MTTFKPPEGLIWLAFRKGDQRFDPDTAKEAAETMMAAATQKYGFERVDAGKAKGIGSAEYEIAKINCAVMLCALVLDPRYDFIFDKNKLLKKGETNGY